MELFFTKEKIFSTFIIGVCVKLLFVLSLLVGSSVCFGQDIGEGDKPEKESVKTSQSQKQPPQKAKDASIPDDNTVALIPQVNPAGFEKGGVHNITHNGLSTASFNAIEANPFMVQILV